METYIRHYAHLDISDLLDEQSATNYAGGAFADIYRAQLRMGPEMLGDSRNTKDRFSWGVSPYRSVTVAVKRFRVYLAESDRLARVSRISLCFLVVALKPYAGHGSGVSHLGHVATRKCPSPSRLLQIPKRTCNCISVDGDWDNSGLLEKE